MNSKHKAFKWVCHELRMTEVDGEVFFNALSEDLQEFKKLFKAMCHQPTPEGMKTLNSMMPVARVHYIKELGLQATAKAVLDAALQQPYRVGDRHAGADLPYADTRAESGADRGHGHGSTWHKGARVRRP